MLIFFLTTIKPNDKMGHNQNLTEVMAMTLGSKEHYELIAQFEKDFGPARFDKEPKELWAKGIVYQDGEMNKLFMAFRLGYSLGKAV